MIQRVRRSHDGTTCSGDLATFTVSMTLYVAGSMMDTVPLLTLGTYTLCGWCRTTSDRLPGRSAAYRSLGSRTGGIPGSGSPTVVLPPPDDLDVADDFMSGMSAIGPGVVGDPQAARATRLAARMVAIQRCRGAGTFTR